MSHAISTRCSLTPLVCLCLLLQIEEYAENYFNLNRKGMFGSKTTVAKILSWKNEVRYVNGQWTHACRHQVLKFSNTYALLKFRLGDVGAL